MSALRICECLGPLLYFEDIINQQAAEFAGSVFMGNSIEPFKVIVFSGMHVRNAVQFM